MSGRHELPHTWDATDTHAVWPFTRLLFDCAEAAYAPHSEGLRAFEALGLVATFLQRGSTQAYVTTIGNDVVVAFRGTEISSLRDILTDLKFIRKHTPDGRMHTGFFEAYDDIHEEILKNVRPFRRKRLRVWLTGHSLGGALAFVAAYRLGSSRIPIAGVVTFGQPKVVMADLAKNLYAGLHDRCVCFINGRDIVPTLVRPYIHGGQLIRFADDAFIRCHAWPRAVDASTQALGLATDANSLIEERSDDDLDALIADLEQRLASSGEADDVRVQGMLPWFDDHKLAAYSRMIDAFVADHSKT